MLVEKILNLSQVFTVTYILSVFAFWNFFEEQIFMFYDVS